MKVGFVGLGIMGRPGAAALNISLPNMSSMQQLFHAARAAGIGTWTHSGVVQVLEKMSAHNIG